MTERDEWLEDPERERVWAEWLADPEHAPVRRVAERFNPWSLYEMTETGQIASVVGYFEDGTVRAAIDPEYNDIFKLRGFVKGLEVFGVDPDTLKPWTPPLDG